MRSAAELRMEKDKAVTAAANVERLQDELGKCRKELSKAKQELKDKGKELSKQKKGWK